MLSRSLAEAGHFPAIDIEQSASRVMHSVVSRQHFEMARRFRAINSRYEKGRDLVQIGAYASGSDPGLDEAIRLHEGMSAFLRQDMTVSVNIETGRRDQAVAIPNDALGSVQGSTAQVIAVRDGKVQRLPVTLGLRGLAMSEIVAGLAAGDTVLADATLALADGSRVRIAALALPL